MQVDIPNVDISHSGSSAENISGVDISQPDNSDVPLELDIPRLNESTSSDPDLGSHLDSHATSGDDWPPSELRDVTASIELPQLQIAHCTLTSYAPHLWTLLGCYLMTSTTYATQGKNICLMIRPHFCDPFDTSSITRLPLESTMS